MKNRIILSTFLLVFLTIGGVFGQISHQWSARTGKGFSNRPERVIVDNDDNIILTGISVSSGDLKSDIVLTKYSPEGDSLWCYYIGITGQSELVGGLCVDDSNNIYITGSYLGTVNFGLYNGTAHTLSSKGDLDLFVARFSPKGQIEWAVSYGTVKQEFGQDLVYNPSDNLLMVVGYNNETSTSVTQGIALTVNPQTGNIENSATLSSTENLKYSEIELVQTKYQVAGSFSGKLGIYSSKGSNDIFIGYIGAENLQFQLQSRYGTANENSIFDLANSNKEYSVLLYEYNPISSNTCDNTIGLYSNDNGYIVKDYCTTGELQAATGKNGYSYFAGNFTDGTNIDNDSYFSDGFNIFIGKNNGYQFLYLQSFKVGQGVYTKNYLCLATNSKGKLIMAGLFGGTLKFGNSKDTVVSKSTITDIFIAQFNVQNSEAYIKDIKAQNISPCSYTSSGSHHKVHVPVGTDLSDLYLSLEISENATISPDPATINDYSTDVNFIITSEDKMVNKGYSIEVIADLDTPSGLQGTYSNSDFEVYPNPATQTVSVKVPEYFSGQVTCTIRALDGRTVREQNMAKKTSTINISDLQPGAYFITIADEKQNLARKLIKN